MADGDLFKGGFGGQGLYVSPARDLVIAFTGTPGQDGSVNLLRWHSRRLALAIGQHPSRRPGSVAAHSPDAAGRAQ